MGKALIAYCSFSGSTRTVAEKIAAQISGELFRNRAAAERRTQS